MVLEINGNAIVGGSSSAGYLGNDCDRSQLRAHSLEKMERLKHWIRSTISLEDLD